MWDEIERQRPIENLDWEESNVQTLSGGPLTISCTASKDANTLPLGLVFDVPEIRPKVDALIADCEAGLGLEMASRSGEKFCWACKLQLDGRDPFEESQNPCSFC